MATHNLAHTASLEPAVLAKMQRRMHGELLAPQSDAYE